ncbi:MAG: shikimate kinase [Christensenellales bacterium]
MKGNLTIIGLNKQFKKNVAKKLAEELDMFYVDINDLIKFDLIDINEIIKTAGIEYYNQQETKAVSLVASYENTLATIDLSTFFSKDNYKLLAQSSTFIYLRLKFNDFKTLLLKERPKSAKYENMLDEKVFYERDEVLKNLSEIVVDVSLKEKNLIHKIIKKIKKFYKDVL